MSIEPWRRLEELCLGLSLAGVAGLSVAASAALLHVDPMVRWLGHDAALGHAAWIATALCVFGAAAIVVLEAVPSGARTGQTLLILAAALSAATLASAIWAHSGTGPAMSALDVLQFYFAPLAILWAPVVGLACAVVAKARGGQKVRARSGGLIAVLGATGVVVALVVYFALRAAGADSPVRVTAGTVIALCSVPFLAAAPLLLLKERRSSSTM